MRTHGLIALTAIVGLATTLGLAACSDDGTLGGGSPAGSNGGTSGNSTSGATSGKAVNTGTDNGRPEGVVEGDITTSRKLTKDKNYLLEGLVSVKAGAVLEIEAGTVIKGDNATKAILLIETGGKIEAKG